MTREPSIGREERCKIVVSSHVRLGGSELQLLRVSQGKTANTAVTARHPAQTDVLRH